MTATIVHTDYEKLVNRSVRDHEIVHMAHTLYDRARSYNRNMPAWREATRAVKREFYREAMQVLGLA